MYRDCPSKFEGGFVSVSMHHHLVSKYPIYHHHSHWKAIGGPPTLITNGLDCSHCSVYKAIASVYRLEVSITLAPCMGKADDLFKSMQN